MKSKYHLALKFFTETKNEEQLKLCHKEIEPFFDKYNEFRLFIELDLRNLDPKLEAQLDHEEKELIKLKDFMIIFNDYRLRNCEDVFSNYNYNFDLFKYALEKIFEEERKMKEEKEAEENVGKNVSDTKGGLSYSYILSVVFFVSILGIILTNYSKLF